MIGKYQNHPSIKLIVSLKINPKCSNSEKIILMR